jgi:hypothetical protein
MDSTEKREMVSNVMSALNEGFASAFIPPAIEHADPLVELIAARFWRCNELSKENAIAYAEIAVNQVRRNTHLITLGK